MTTNKKRKLIFRILAIISGFVGVAILSSVIYSLVSYKVLSQDKFPTLLNPVIEKANLTDNVYDYTKASNWFAGSDKKKFDEAKVSYYNITIPRLKIDNAIVAIGGEDLSAHLIQYPGTALPGKRGNAVIFGHSTLPSFYNPKNYTTIFSTLSMLNKGDEIIVYYDGIEYHYKVESLAEVLPTDVEVLEQNISDSYITLVTCTPPGDPRKPRRLIVRARIVPLSNAKPYYFRG
jgi:sortase A